MHTKHMSEHKFNWSCKMVLEVEYVTHVLTGEMGVPWDQMFSEKYTQIICLAFDGR